MNRDNVVIKQLDRMRLLYKNQLLLFCIADVAESNQQNIRGNDKVNDTLYNTPLACSVFGLWDKLIVS